MGVYISVACLASAVSGGDTEGELAVKCCRLSSRLPGRSAVFASSSLGMASPHGWDDNCNFE